MRVLELWRYPVKSLQGERLDEVALTGFGLEGDRSHALVEVATGRVLSAVQEPPLLLAAGRLRPDGGAEVVLPDGRSAVDGAELSAWLGRPVRLERASGGSPPPSADGAGAGPATRWDGPAGSFHDYESARVSIVGQATIRSLGDWDVRRFRPNVVVEGQEEDGLVGSRVRLGGATLDVGEPLARCVLVTRPQPGGIDRDLGVLRTIQRKRRGELAVGAVVVEPGPVRVGDHVEVLS